MSISHRLVAGLILGLACMLVAVPSVAETHWPKDGWSVIDTSQS
jgi:hypothetical protein